MSPPPSVIRLPHPFPPLTRPLPSPASPPPPPAKRRRTESDNNNNNNNSHESSRSEARSCGDAPSCKASSNNNNNNPNNSNEVSELTLSNLSSDVQALILTHVERARDLLRLRLLNRHFRDLIDDPPPGLWTHKLFTHVDFSRRVILAPRAAAPTRSGKHRGRRQAPARRLTVLSPRPGAELLRRAAADGNTWAATLLRTLYDRRARFYAVTLTQPLAETVVAARLQQVVVIGRPCNATAAAAVEQIAPGWVGVHAARFPAVARVPAAADRGRDAAEAAEELDEGGMVGVVEVRRVERIGWRIWRWVLGKRRRLRRMIRCAGFRGVWSVSECLLELIVAQVHGCDEEVVESERGRGKEMEKGSAEEVGEEGWALVG